MINKKNKLPFLSIIIPCFNEEKTIKKLIKKILKVKNINKQIIVVNDGSLDKSFNIINSLKSKIDVIINHKNNLGKGSCIKSAKNKIKGNIVLIQDADLEYDPKDYLILIDPIVKKKYKIVYGSRVLNKNRFENLDNFTHCVRIFANYILTKINNIINNQNLSDAHTCYKVFDSKIFKKIKLVENDFAFCPEATTKISNLGYKIYEVPISYKGRTYSEGKKIKFSDGIKAIFTIIKYKFFFK
jgi:glycosyltransferase involved in cell wall biosynthesis